MLSLFSSSLLVLSLFLFALVSANGNLPGSCLKDGTVLYPPGSFPGAGIYNSYCPSGYGRPTGVCNCVTRLNSCAANLAGCPGTESGVFYPPLPSVLYVGRSYQFNINISSASLDSLCFLRPLPSGLSWIMVTPDFSTIDRVFAIAGTPTESMPMANYGVAASRGAQQGFSTFFSFEVQSCALDEAVFPTFPPTQSSTPTTAPTTAPTQPSTPTSAPTPKPTQSSTACTTGNMRCVGTTQYQSCAHEQWAAAQSCGAGLVCKPSGSNIYCQRP